MNNIKEYFSFDKDIRNAIKENAKINAIIENFNDAGYRADYEIPDRYPDTKYKSWFTASDLGLGTGKSLCGKYTIGCLRRMYLKVKGAPKKAKIPGSLRRRWDAGSALHEVFQRYAIGASERGMGIDDIRAEYEVVPEMGGLAKDYRFIGKVDLIYKKGYYKYISEIKSKGHNAFLLLGSPDDEHITQINTYMALLDVPVGSIFYVAFSGKVPSKEFIVEFDQGRWDACTKKMDLALDMANRDELPDPEGMDVNPFYCKTCPYYYRCVDKTLSVPDSGSIAQ